MCSVNIDRGTDAALRAADICLTCAHKHKHVAAHTVHRCEQIHREEMKNEVEAVQQSRCVQQFTAGEHRDSSAPPTSSHCESGSFRTQLSFYWDCFFTSSQQHREHRRREVCCSPGGFYLPTLCYSTDSQLQAPGTQ